MSIPPIITIALYVDTHGSYAEVSDRNATILKEIGARYSPRGEGGGLGVISISVEWWTRHNAETEKGRGE